MPGLPGPMGPSAQLRASCLVPGNPLPVPQPENPLKAGAGAILGPPSCTSRECPVFSVFKTVVSKTVDWIWGAGWRSHKALSRFLLEPQLVLSPEPEACRASPGPHLGHTTSSHTVVVIWIPGADKEKGRVSCPPGLMFQPVFPRQYDSIDLTPGALETVNDRVCQRCLSMGDPFTLPETIQKEG